MKAVIQHLLRLRRSPSAALSPVNAVAKHKFQALDSLRGIAAIMVVFQHLWEMNHPSAERLRPWLFFCAGHEAVILFFVLSGLVLSHQLRNFTWETYPAYLLKRVVRIYPAYYLALGFSALLLVYIEHFHASGLPGLGLTNWFYIWSQTHFDWIMLWGSLSLIGHQGNSLDVAIWTLFYEVWLSLGFPLMLTLLFKGELVQRWFAVLVLAGCSYILWAQNLLLDNPWAAIFYYAWYFILGMLIYKFQALWARIYRQWFLVLGVLLYFSNFVLFGKIVSRLVHEIIIASGSVLIILSCLYHHKLKLVLFKWPWRFYGSISYSLYLLHLPVIYGLSYLLLPTHSIAIVKCLAFILVTILATLNCYGVEYKFTLWIKRIVDV